MIRCSLHHEQVSVDNHDSVDQGATDPQVTISTSGANVITVEAMVDEENHEQAVERSLSDHPSYQTVSEVLICQADNVVTWVGKELFPRILLIENSEDHDWERSEGNIVELIEDWLVKGLSTKCRCETVPELGHHEEDVFVEHINCQNRVPTVSFATMDEQKWFKVLKL